MTTKIDVPTGLVLAGAVALLVSLFLEWFAPGLSGWNAFEALDLLLAALAVGAAAVATGRLDRARPASPALLPALCGLALVVVVVQLADPPPAAFDADRETGAWLALAGTLLMAAGAVLTVARVSVVVDVRGRDIRRRVPAVDARDSAPARHGATRPGSLLGDAVGTRTTPEPGTGAGRAGRPDGAQPGGLGRAAGPAPAQHPAEVAPDALADDPAGVARAAEAGLAAPDALADADPDRTEPYDVQRDRGREEP